ncbi:MAG: tRNA pseudouridine(55) synthase TruB [Phycisphaerales bacterium]|nr:tRNA pseudouridine(55) synthase TruB [Phycisphaerales bacterium]
MDGIINFNKPVGTTSAKALYKVRAITRQRKSGHAGTLDPGASGVLVLCMGRATKLVERIMDRPKVYRATARLDVTSESFDADRPLLPVPVARTPTGDELRSALLSFEGAIEQIPPDISAVKVGGVPAYKRARRGQPLELKPRTIHVYWLHLHEYDFPNIDFEMCCGRGAYVRALVRDLGQRLHTGGCLTSLARLRVGPFTLDDAWTLDALQRAADPTAYLIELSQAVRLLETGATIVPPRPSEA